MLQIIIKHISNMCKQTCKKFEGIKTAYNFYWVNGQQMSREYKKRLADMRTYKVIVDGDHHQHLSADRTVFGHLGEKGVL